MVLRNSKYILLIALLLVADVAFGQCSMCRAVSESNLKGGGASAIGLNNGIMYLMAFPYILMGIIGFLWYRHRKANA